MNLIRVDSNAKLSQIIFLFEEVRVIAVTDMDL